MITPSLLLSIRGQKNPDDKRRKGERQFWGSVAENYDEWRESAFKDLYKVFRAKITDYLQAEDFALEIGTGTGDIAFDAARKCEKVVGIDISSEMIAIANKKRSESNLENLSFQVEDAYKLPFNERSFSKVIACNSLQTMKDPAKAIREGRRVLKERGEFISVTYCFGDSGLIEQIKLIKWVILFGKPRYWQNFRSSNLISHFEDAGLEILENEIIWVRPYVLFLRCRKM